MAIESVSHSPNHSVCLLVKLLTSNVLLVHSPSYLLQLHSLHSMMVHGCVVVVVVNDCCARAASACASLRTQKC